MTMRRLDTGTEVLNAEVRKGVGVITMNRPDRRNALHADMYPAALAALDDFAGADDVGCVVLTGAGTAFCAGGDVTGGARRSRDEPRPSDGDRAAALTADAELAARLIEHPKITMAAVNGPAVGAGLSLALACDLRIATSSARFQTGWVRLGFSGDFGGTWLLARLVGPSRAIELLVGNHALDMERARGLGLVNRVEPDDSFATAWRQWSEQLAAGPRPALAAIKANVRDALRLGFRDHLQLESARQVASSRTAEHKEAVAAWMEGRDPEFTTGRP